MIIVMGFGYDVFIFPHLAERWYQISYIDTITITNALAVWYRVPNGDLLFYGAILGFAIRYASRIVCDLRNDKLRYRLIVMLCQEGVGIEDVKRLKGSVIKNGGVEDALYYFGSEGGSR